MNPLRIQIDTQGAVLVNGGEVLHAGPSVAALSIDLKSKYAECTSWGSGSDEMAPCVFLDATEHTLHLDPSKARDAPTMVSFPDYLGWTVHTASVGRYTLSVCLVDMRVGAEDER